MPVGKSDVELNLDRLDLCTQRGHALRVLLPCGVQSGLSLINDLLTAFTLLLPSRLFLGLFALAPLPLPFVSESGLALSGLIGGPARHLLRFHAFRFAGTLRRSSADAQFVGQFRVLAEWTGGSDGALENDAGFAIVAATTSGSSLSFAAP